MNRMLTNEVFLERAAEASPTVQVKGKYSGHSGRVLTECKSCGYQWRPIGGQLLRGVGCPKCAGNARLSIEELRARVQKRHPHIEVSGEYKNQDLYITRCRGCGLLSVERHPTNHDKCRPLKARMVESVSVIPAASPLAAVPEKTHPVTENQRASAREFEPDNHLAFLRDLSWWDFSANDNKLLFSLKPSSRLRTR